MICKQEFREKPRPYLSTKECTANLDILLRGKSFFNAKAEMYALSSICSYMQQYCAIKVFSSDPISRCCHTTQDLADPRIMGDRRSNKWHYGKLQ